MKTHCDLSGYRIDYSVTYGKRSTWDDGNCFETRLTVSVQGCCGLFKLAHLMPGEYRFKRPATVSSHRFLPTKEDMYKVTKELKSSGHLVTSQQSYHVAQYPITACGDAVMLVSVSSPAEHSCARHIRSVEREALYLQA